MWIKTLNVLYSIVQVVVHVDLFIFTISPQKRSQSDEMLCCKVRHYYRSSYHRLHAAFQRQSENERFESQFIMHGTIGLDCSARSPPALCIRPGGACVVGVHRDESFRGHDKGSALGKILCYCGWISVQWAGWGSNTLGWQSTGRSPPPQPPPQTRTLWLDSILCVRLVVYVCMYVIHSGGK